MASQQVGSEPHPRLYRPRQWLSERQPTRWDVHDANESPTATFLDRFRVALLHSEGAEEAISPDLDTVIGTSETMGSQDSVSSYTYLMVMLSDAPTISLEHVLAQLQAAFFSSFEQHVFIKSVVVTNFCAGRPPPYLQLALACLGSVTATLTGSTSDITTHESPQAGVSADLFIAGVNLWSVMLEVDNRESRSCAAIVAAALFSTYGTLSANFADRRKASGVLYYLATMSRHTHLTDGYSPVYAYTELPAKDFGVKSSLVCYLILVDAMQAVHFRRTPNFSMNELFIRMPSSDHHFRTVYNSLTHGYALPSDVQSEEDALLLLTAMLNDIIYMQQCHLSMPYPPSYQESDTRGISSSQITPLPNPWAPLSLQSEFCRLGADMLAALSRWHHIFKHRVRNEILALYYFTELQLLCPDLGDLSLMADYPVRPNSSSSPPKTTRTLDIADKALDLAWLILDHSDSTSSTPEWRLSVWLPVVLFSAALVVWHRLQSPAGNNRRYGTLSVLTTFKHEIAKLPWPCCRIMTKTLDRLMGKYATLHLIFRFVVSD